MLPMRHGKQIKIANWIGESPSYISRILNGKKRPSPSRAEVFEGVTGVPMRDWLLLDHKKLKAKVEIAYEVTCHQQQETAK